MTNSPRTPGNFSPAASYSGSSSAGTWYGWLLAGPGKPDVLPTDRPPLESFFSLLMTARMLSGLYCSITVLYLLFLVNGTTTFGRPGEKLLIPLVWLHPPSVIRSPCTCIAPIGLVPVGLVSSGSMRCGLIVSLRFTRLEGGTETHGRLLPPGVPRL